MNLFGDLFGHDKVSARASGKFTDDPTQMQMRMLPQAPPPSSGVAPAPAPGFNPPVGGQPSLPQAPPMTGNIGSGFSFTPSASPQIDQLPKAPPPQSKAGAFDDDHYRQTMLAMAAGFFGSQNFGDGLSKAAEAIYNGNADAQKKAQVSYGGPADAFEIATDPHTGKRTYTPVGAVVDYQHDKAVRAAAAKDKGPSAKDSLDAIGRLASVVSKYAPKDQAQAWAEGRAQLAAMGFDGVPDAYHPAYTEFGASVPQMVRASTGVERASEAARHNGVLEGQGAARIAQGNERIGLSAAASGRAAQSNTRANLKAGISPDGYQYRMGPNGKNQRRKVF